MSHREDTENTSLLNTSRDEVTEDEIVSYVQNRRESIISMKNEPFQANLQARLPQSDRLSAVKSTSSSLDLSAILSHHSMLPEPETTLGKELTVLALNSIPLIVTFFLQYSLTAASIFSVGRLGSRELAAVSLSSMTANVSAYAILQGISTSLDTLCAQSFGRKDYNGVGLHYMKCNYLMFMIYIPVLILWGLFSKPILMAIVDDEELCVLASRYLKILAFGIPGYIVFENTKHFLQCQGIFHASTYVLAFCAPLNVLLNYLLVWNKTIGIGFDGAPLSVVIVNYLMCILLLLYTFYVKGYECWPKGPVFSTKFFKKWDKLVNLSIPGVLVVEAEWLAFEIITFASSKFGTDYLAAQSIVSTSSVLLYQVPFAFSIAVSTRVAWFIGAAAKKTAIVATRATLVASLFVGLFNFSILFIFRNQLAKLYTNDQVVIEIASSVLIIGSLYQVNDAFSCGSAGVLRGQGRQKIAGMTNLFSYYFVALPIAFFCGFFLEWKLLGLWAGMIIALFLISVLQVYFVVTSDWDKIISDSINEGITDGIIIETHPTVPSNANI